MKTIIASPKAPKAVGPYCQAVNAALPMGALVEIDAIARK